MDVCLHSLEYMPRSGIAGSYGDSVSPFEELPECFPKWLQYIHFKFKSTNASWFKWTLIISCDGRVGQCLVTAESGGGEGRMGDDISSRTWSGCLGPRVVGKMGLGLSPGEQGRTATAGEASGGPRSASRTWRGRER